MSTIDTTIRPICFGIDRHINKTEAQKVGSEGLKRYEYILYIMAQICRFTHSDSGFSWQAMKTSFGQSNDIVNHLLYKYDTEQKSQRTKRAPIGDGAGRPMLSYMTPTQPKTSTGCWGKYISTHADMTALVLDASTMPLKANPNSIFKPTDIIVSFKSTSSVLNLLTDILSQIVPSIDLQYALLPEAIYLQEGVRVPWSFVALLMTGWPALIKAIKEFSKDSKHRLFITGHSLAGVLGTLMGFILAESKILPNIESIHIISFGAPKLFNKTGVERFNKHLDSGFLTYDRVVSQTEPSLKSDLYSILVNNDYIPGFPRGYKHPGFASDESITGPYSIDTVRKFYGQETTTRFRDEQSWPFPDDDSHMYVQPLVLNKKAAALMKGGGTHQPNFLSIAPIPGRTFVHGETLGMVPSSAHRYPQMKNSVGPASNLISYFSFCPTGVKIEYLTPEGNLVCYKNPSPRKTRSSKSKKRTTRSNK